MTQIELREMPVELAPKMFMSLKLRSISDEDLLKIMLWTLRISEMRFKHPTRLMVAIHKDNIDKINLLDIKSARYGV